MVFQYMGILYFATTQNTKRKVRFSSLPLVKPSPEQSASLLPSQHWDVNKQTLKVTQFFSVCFHLFPSPLFAHRR